MSIIIIFIGLGILTYGISNILTRNKLVPISKIITGTVIGFRETCTKKGRKAYYPVIEYYDPGTNNTESFQHEAASERPKYNIGDSLELRYYNGEDKKLVLINTWSGIWGAPIAFTIAGAVITAFGVLMRLK